MFPNRTKRFLIAGGLILLLGSSCSFLPERDDPLESVVPDEFSGEGGETLSQRWWEDFKDPGLTRLIEEALVGNLGLAQIDARLRQAQATAVIAGGGLYPELNLSLEGGVTRARTGDPGNRVTVNTENYSAALAASYEIDLWGRVRSTAGEADALVSAALGDLSAARISLAAEVADRWLTLVEMRAGLRLVHNQLETNRSYLELLRLRQRKGLTSALAVFQQEQIVAATSTLIPLIESELETTQHQLAILLGRPPRSDLGVKTDKLPEIAPLPSLGLPAELISNRPDIQAAFYRLESSDYAVAAARANRLPALTLTGSAGYSSDEFARLFNNWFAGFAAGLLAPLFDGGRRSAEADRALAVSDEKLAAYREVVLSAFKEVEDSLVREQKQQEYIDSMSRQYKASTRALGEAMLRYRKGDSEYLDVLSALNTTQGLERDALAAHRDLLAFRVGLYRALAGRWEEQTHHENTGEDIDE